MNLSRIRSEMVKLQELAAERERVGKLPLTIVVLPESGRGPDTDVGRPLPRVAWRNQRAVCIVYQDGPPTAEDIARLIEGAQ
jgi:hypothetical protein